MPPFYLRLTGKKEEGDTFFASVDGLGYDEIMAKVLNYRVIVEQDEDGVFVASAPGIPGCHTQGETYEDVLKNIKEAIGLCLEVARDYPDYKSKIDDAGSNPQSRFIGVTDVAIQV